MNRFRAFPAAIAAAILVPAAAVAASGPLAEGIEAYKVVPEHADVLATREAIQAGDRLAIRVFGEPELSGENYIVDGAGYLQLPLLGEIIAAGQTGRELAAELTRRLGSRYVRGASVTVSVVSRPQATFTVEGDVNSPGVFPVTPSTTLLSALAQAKSPTKTAKTDEIIVFRTINGERSGGRFRLGDIRRGRAADPQIVAGDTVVVVNSALKSAWRDTISALPLVNTFFFIRNK